MENFLLSLSETDRHTFQLGLLTKSWAAAELMLDIAAAIAFGDLGGRDHSKEMPRSLSNKLRMLRRVLSARAKMLPILPDCIEIIDCTVESSTFRNLCVHGVAIFSGDAFTVQYFERFPQSIKHNAQKITENDLNDACAQAALLIPAWSHVVPLVCSLAAIQLPPRLAVSPVQSPAPRPKPTKIEARLLQALDGMRCGRQQALG